MKRDSIWWVRCCFHNWIVHPMLPFADALDSWGPNSVSQFVYNLHDTSYPVGGG